MAGSGAASATSPVTTTDDDTGDPRVITLREHSVEVVSDSGEGAQSCGQIFGTISAKMGNGVWTVEIIPAEVEPPPRNPAGASGIRIRLGSEPVTNWGDETKLVVAFNEQALLGRHHLNAFADDAILLVEDMWEDHKDEEIRAEWAEAMEELEQHDYRIIRVPMEEQCLTLVEDARLGKNMFVLGLLCWLYDRDLQKARDQIAWKFRKKKPEITEKNHKLLELGYEWAGENLDFRFEIPAVETDQEMVVMNGNQAIALGSIASGMELAAMYPITPATSVSHYLGDLFEKFGGVVHQAEDEIAAAGVAIGASFAGRTAFTITSGPGIALKTEFLGLAIMTEVPLVVIDVQRGGPSTGLPTKVEQSDLLATTFGQPGDAPHVVMAPATIEDCFYAPITARRIAEAFRTVVVILTDANLATGVAPYARPDMDVSWQASAPDTSPVPEGTIPYDWDEKTGLAKRIIPGQKNGMFVATGLAHDEHSHVAYDADIVQKSMTMRARKMAVFQSTLEPPEVYGDEEGGELLIVGWGSTKGAIEEAVDRAREEGLSVSSTHLYFLSPLQPGLEEIFNRFDKVMTVEINYSDEPDAPFVNELNRRRGQLAYMLRAQTLVDVDCWTRVIGEPLRPGKILEAIRQNMPGAEQDAVTEAKKAQGGAR